jgi:predicted nuclease of predicted toxin-antitoxin system
MPVLCDKSSSPRVARIRFQLDEHVPAAVARALRRRGIDVQSTAEAGLLGASDTEHLRASHAEGRVFVTHDSDLLRLHEQGTPHAGIAFCEQGSRSVGQIVRGLILIYEALDADEMASQVEFL